MIKKADPDTLIGGPTTCGTDISWISTILSLGGDKYLDVITEHPYRQSPELPDYDVAAKGLRKAVDKYKKNYPVIGSESGERSVSIFPYNNMINDESRYQVAYNTRLMLIGFANGVSRFHHFTFRLELDGAFWYMLMMGNPDNNYTPTPAPLMYALRNTIDRLEDAKSVGDVALGHSFRCYLFDREDARIATIWKWQGKPSIMELPESLKSAKIYDVMGSLLDNNNITLNEYPIYVESKLSTEEFKKSLKNINLAVSGDVFDASFEVNEAKKITINIRNLSSKVISGTILANKKEYKFGPVGVSKIGKINLDLDKEITLENYPLNVKVEVPDFKQSKSYDWNLRAILAPETKNALVIDGDLSDWSDKSKAFELKNHKDGVKPAKARLMWDENYLYLAVTVNKKDYIESKMGKTALWQGDSIQFGFDPTRNATKETVGYLDDDFEYDIARYNGKLIVYRRNASSGTYDSVSKDIGEITEVTTAIKVTENGIVYEMAFPRLSISPFKLQTNSAMRINILSNFADKSGRTGYSQLTPGIGEGTKRPGLFMDMVLVP